MIEKLKEKIADAELVLVGIGEELEIRNSGITNTDMHDVISERKQCYNGLKSLIENKNYFVITLCMDGIIHEAGLKEEKIVEPCGTFYKLQCSNKCTADIYEPDDRLKDRIRQMIEGEISEADLKLSDCPKCGAPLVFNNILAENYAEEGYLDKWQIYTKWLQGTVNRKICLLELGVGMRFPTVIRWPFEKITFFNQKATLFRVHSKLYQITEEIRDRSIGIQEKPTKFMKELSNQV